MVLFPGSSIIVYIVLELMHKLKRQKSIFSRQEYMYYWVYRATFSFFIGACFYLFLYHISFVKFEISGYDLLLQVILLYLSFDFFISTFHQASHKYFNYKALHDLHHGRYNLHWVNSSKESWLFEVVIVLVYSFLIYIFSLSAQVFALVFIFWKIMLALTHYSYPFSYGIFDFIFVSSKHHKEHHSSNHGHSYGVTLSILDKIQQAFKK